MMLRSSANLKYSTFFILFRLLSVIVVQTFFVPDEFWQSLEVAHNFSFGYGYLTWEWQLGIRNCAYPVCITVLYNSLKWFNCDSVFLVTHLPRILQALSVAIGDLFLLRLCFKQYGNDATRWTAFSLSTLWFLFYCTPRTIINNTEMVMSTICFTLFPWPTQSRSLNSTGYIWLASVLCLIRPTAIILWLPLFSWHWLITKSKCLLLSKAMGISIFSLVIMTIADSYCYGRFVLTAYNFFWYNWTKDISCFYGTNSWHWYFSQGIPVVLGVHIVPFILGLKKRSLWPKYILIFWMVFVLSFIAHKEFRFLLPVLPLVAYICGVSLHSLKGTKFNSYKKFIAALMLLVNIPTAIYFSTIHQRGVLDIMNFIKAEVLKDSNTNVLFLMPCHSTPYYSHVHANISMRFLTCEPNLEGSRDNYVDEAEEFYKDPTKWIKEQILTSNELSTHVVLFDTIVTEFTKATTAYRKCFQTFHTHFPSNRIGKYIYVFCYIT